jgi:hypothetical protein
VIQRTSITSDKAASKGRQTGDISARPFTEMRPKSALAWQRREGAVATRSPGRRIEAGK